MVGVELLPTCFAYLLRHAASDALSLGWRGTLRQPVRISAVTQGMAATYRKEPKRLKIGRLSLLLGVCSFQVTARN